MPIKKKIKSLSFQEIIMNLQKFWGKYGCVILQPYDLEVGAGTFHPATTLRSLGPKPWKAAYVQPSRRPTDGRYGENPNRLQHYYQYQVIIKPSPDNIKQTYLKSFESTENECKALLDRKLSLPAYAQCLKASHIFNLLDARGVIGVAERTGYINRIRELAKGCGALWLSTQI